MFSPLRNRFGIPGVISVIALVFAMLGGAYAASNSSGGGKATASAKAKRGPKGPKGATGPAGPAGPQGPAGANGKDGANGSAGDKGATGAAGANGQSVKTEVEPPLGNCGEQEGVKLTSASGVNYVCNGEKGTSGSKGDPWTAGGTLPAGATETGTWAFSAKKESLQQLLGSGLARLAVSFNVPLGTGLDAAHVINATSVIPEECENENHPGSASVSNPEAKPGYLCVYKGLLNGAFLGSVQDGEGAEGASTAGAVLVFFVSSETGFGQGTWAVTG